MPLLRHALNTLFEWWEAQAQSPGSEPGPCKKKTLLGERTFYVMLGRLRMCCLFKDATCVSM